jgi:hypothetical protein
LWIGLAPVDRPHHPDPRQHGRSRCGYARAVGKRAAPVT